MRATWVQLAGLAFLSALGPGCSSSGGTTSSGSSGTGTSAGSSGGTAGGSSSGGTTGGGKVAGAPCSGNAECASTLCGINDSSNGHCCSAACSSVTAPCGATDCTATGACAYPTGTTACGTTCTGSALAQNACDGAGACVPGSSAPCPNHLACNGAMACYAQCASGTAECAAGFYCLSQNCVAQKAAGQPCSSDVSCALGICGVDGGTGNCCIAKCETADPICGATLCDGQGLCNYQTSQIQCRAPSCAGDTLTKAANCDGAGKCPAVTTAVCSPYVCTGTPSACATTCTGGGTSCVPGGFCDTAYQACCAGLARGGSIAVDGATGSDAAGCCGIGSNQACQTLTRAMQLIDEVQAQDVTIVATVNGVGGNWTAAETYPVVLGWGVELSAPGVFFLEQRPSANPLEIFDIGAYSPSDTVGYASVAGSAQSAVNIGMDRANHQTDANAAIRVEPGATLYLANASVNGSADGHVAFSALTVSAGASLMLGQDQSGAVTGTVTIGNALGAEATDGNYGIFCETDYLSAGCTINDAALKGQSSVVIQGQRTGDIFAAEYSTISLTSNPVIGVPPNGAGFNQCPQKDDGVGAAGTVYLQGKSKVTFHNGVVQCIGGTGFLLQPSPFGIGTPSLDLDNSVIRNTELGIWGRSGTALVTNTTINYNVIGVKQTQDDSGNNGSIDLSGGGNTVICSSINETSQSYWLPGVDVYNTSTAPLDASNVTWDTASPDYFDCDLTFLSCKCKLNSCTTADGADDMDAVEDSSAQGGIKMAGAIQSKIGCN